MGEGSAAPARALPRLARRPRPADPGRPDGDGLPRVRAAQVGARRDRLRGSARAGGAPARGRRPGPRDLPRALPRVHGRRVPGRQPAPADAARPVARRPRRPLRRRRRLPVDLPVHRRLAALAARGRGALPGRDRRSAREQLPLEPGGARAREPARAAPRRRREDAEGDPAFGPGTRRAALRRSGGRGRVDRGGGKAARGRGDAVRGDGGARPHERAPGRLRGGLPRRGDPVPGLVARSSAMPPAGC